MVFHLPSGNQCSTLECSSWYRFFPFFKTQPTRKSVNFQSILRHTEIYLNFLLRIVNFLFQFRAAVCRQSECDDGSVCYCYSCCWRENNHNRCHSRRNMNFITYFTIGCNRMVGSRWQRRHLLTLNDNIIWKKRRNQFVGNLFCFRFISDLLQ